MKLQGSHYYRFRLAWVAGWQRCHLKT